MSLDPSEILSRFNKNGIQKAPVLPTIVETPVAQSTSAGLKKHLTFKNVAILVLVLALGVGAVFLYLKIRQRNKVKQQRLKELNESAKLQADKLIQLAKEKQEKPVQKKKPEPEPEPEPQKKPEPKQAPVVSQQTRQAVQPSAPVSAPVRDTKFTLLAELFP